MRWGVTNGVMIDCDLVNCGAAPAFVDTLRAGLGFSDTPISGWTAVNSDNGYYDELSGEVGSLTHTGTATTVPDCTVLSVSIYIQTEGQSS